VPLAENLAQMLVLIVEDNPASMLLTDAVLKRAGFLTLGATCADEVRERLRDYRPDLILMDLQLPGVDGLTLTRELKSDPSLADIPVVALSAHAMKEDRWRVLTAGCDGYIAKPFDTRSIGREVEHYIAEARARGMKRR